MEASSDKTELLSSVAVAGQAPRIVHLTTVHHPFDPRIFHKQLGSLSAAGFDTHLIAPHARREDVDGVTIHPLPVPENRWQRIALQPKAFRQARFLEADLYQIHDPELIPLGFLLKEKTGAPIIYDMHEDYRTKGAVVGRGLRALERWCFRWVDHVLLAEKSYRPIVEQSTVDHTYIANYFKAIGDPNEREGRQEERPVSSPTRLLYTGTVSNARGLDTMIELAGTIRERSRPERLDIVGICRYPNQRGTAETRIERDGLNPVVTRVGWDTYVPAKSMSPYYRRADVGLALCEPHPNLVGSLLTKFYEYLYYGLPLICSDFPLWRDFVEEHECGAVVPPGDVEAVIDVLDRWRRSPEDYRRCARNAQAASSQYRWENMGRRLVKVCRQVISEAQEAVAGR
jgi:glycosyltransferase involved in cell wall biosynthesis